MFNFSKEKTENTKPTSKFIPTVEKSNSNHKPISKKMILTIIFLIASLLMFYFMGYNKYLQIVETKDSLAQEEERLDKYMAQKEYLDNLVDQRNELEERQVLAQQAVPLTDEVSNLMNQLVEIAKTIGGLSLDSLNFSGFVGDDTSASFKKVALHLSITGSFRDIVNFVEKVETSRRILIIDSIAYNSSIADDSLISTYELSLTLSAFYLPEISVEDLTIDELTKSPSIDDIVVKLRSYKYYTVDGTYISVGDNNDPFQMDDNQVVNTIVVGDENGFAPDE